MLQGNLLKSKPGAPVRAIAIARTAIAVQTVNPVLKGTFIRYLWEAGLILRPAPIMNLFHVNLNGAFFAHANLYQVYLGQVDLTNANFFEAELRGADLNGSVLIQANLENADLTCFGQNAPNVCTDLSASYLIRANMQDANLSGADLRDADLVGANMTRARLAGANLHGAIYNTKPTIVRNAQGHLVIDMPTRWPEGFDSKAAGATCDDC
jgi:uncharacterized protein YjbI with pentapeptide repeats